MGGFKRCSLEKPHRLSSGKRADEGMESLYTPEWEAMSWDFEGGMAVEHYGKEGRVGRASGTERWKERIVNEE